MSLCVFVVHTFVRRDGKVFVLPPTICFEQGLALEMAAADMDEADGVAVYELNGAAENDTQIRPFASYGTIPAFYRRIRRDSLLAVEPPARLRGALKLVSAG